MKQKLKYLGIFIFIWIGGMVFVSRFSKWLDTPFGKSTEQVIGAVLFAFISTGICAGLYILQKGKDVPDDHIRLSKLVTAIIQWGILMAFFYGVWGWGNTMLIGIAVICLQMIFPLRFAGWVAAVAYPVTYCISYLCDTPEAGNFFVYWYFSYIGILVVAILADVLLKKAVIDN